MEKNIPEDRLRWNRPQARARLGHVSHALFDLDGTISTMRHGWEAVMKSLMLEVLCASQPPPPEIEAEVNDYVGHSTGTPTIRQMEWLAKTAARHGLKGGSQTGEFYKQIFLERLAVLVRQRQAQLESGQAARTDFTIRGAIEFINGLAGRGVRLYLASGTDHEIVVNDAEELGLLGCFNGGVFGALAESDAHAKDRVIGEIIERSRLEGRQLLVVGDGPFEIREAARHGALALGLATDEDKGQGWNEDKAERLAKAGADLLIPDFRDAEYLVNLFCGETF